MFKLKPFLTLLLIVVIIAFFSKQISASVDTIKPEVKKNTIFAEAFSYGSLYSFHYDRILLAKEKFKISTGVGISYGSKFWTDFIEAPVELNFLFGRKNGHFETGLAVLTHYILDNRSTFRVSDLILSPVVKLGYRYQSPEGGLFFRTGMFLETPPRFYYWKRENNSLISTTHYLRLGAGLGLGYTF